MESIVSNMEPSQDIMPRGRLDTADSSPVFASAQGGHNIPRMISANQDSQALVPVGSNSIIPANSDDIIRRSPKRYRMESEHGNSALEIPSSFQEALKSPEAKFWKAAITSELKALSKKNTWTVMTNTGNQKAIGTKWVFTIERNESGDVERYKARLVALGYRQIYGVDYLETYSPVASLNSIRIFLAISCHKGYSIHQFDVDTAFLNAHLKEEVSIYPPEGVGANTNQIFKPNRSFYGLKQATATWFKTITCIFVNMRFKQSATDSCIFIREDINSQIYVTLYVDDMLISAKSIDTINEVASEISKHFKLKMLGNVRFIFGIEVDYIQGTCQMKISQGAFI